MTKKFLTALLFVSVTAAVARADDFKNNFQANLAQQPLNSLAQDIGALMGGGSFHEGKALGFPIGFDVGVHVPFVTLHDDDKILRDDMAIVPAVWGQAEVGLPAHINVIGRVGKLADANLTGGGLRIGLLNPSAPGLPALSVEGLYSHLKHDYLTAETYSANAALSINLPVIHPYIGGGYDYTKLNPTDLAFQGAPASVPRNLKGKKSGYRAELGVNLSVIPFTYVTAAAGLANGLPMYHAGLGVHF